MSRFSQSFAGKVAAAHEHQFSQSVTLTEQNTPSTQPAVLHTAIAETRGEKRVHTRKCRFTKLQSLRHDAIVTIDGQDWQIDQVHSITATGVLCTLVRTLVNEVARSGYRK